MSIFEQLTKRASKRALRDLETDENYRFLRKNYLFKALSNEALLFIMKRLIIRHYAKNELIFKQDNPGICIFIVKTGSVEIYMRKSDGEKTIAAISEEGSLFGEISIISSTYRTATARALEGNTTLLALSSLDMREIDTLFPRDSLKILKGITDTIIKNLLDTNRELRSKDIEIQELRRKLEKNEAR